MALLLVAIPYVLYHLENKYKYNDCNLNWGAVASIKWYDLHHILQKIKKKTMNS